MKRKIVVVTTLFLLVIPNFSKPLLANPAVLAPAGELFVEQIKHRINDTFDWVSCWQALPFEQKLVLPR